MDLTEAFNGHREERSDVAILPRHREERSDVAILPRHREERSDVAISHSL